MKRLIAKIVDILLICFMVFVSFGFWFFLLITVLKGDYRYISVICG